MKKALGKQDKNRVLFVVVLFWSALYLHMPYQTVFLLNAGVSADVVGVVVGAYGLSQVFLRIPLGLLADIGGRHKVFLVGGPLFIALAAVSRTLLTNSTGFLIANICSGISAATWISYMVYFAGFYPANKMTTSNGRIISANNFGVFIAYIIGLLVYSRWGMSFLCIIAFAIALGATLLISTEKEPRKPARRPSMAVIKELFGSCMNANLVLFSLIALLVQGLIFATSNSFSGQILNMLGAKSWQLGVFSVISTSAMMTTAYLSSLEPIIRQGRRKFILAAFVVLGIGCLLLPNTEFIWQVYLIGMMSGFANGFAYSYVTSEAIAQTPVFSRSTAVGFFQAVYALGMCLMPIAVGYLVKRYDIATAYYACAGLCLLAVLTILTVIVKERQWSAVGSH